MTVWVAHPTVKRTSKNKNLCNPLICGSLHDQSRWYTQKNHQHSKSIGGNVANSVVVYCNKPLHFAKEARHIGLTLQEEVAIPQFLLVPK